MKRFETIMASFARITAKSLEIEKIPRDFGVGDLLYHSEIHTVFAIGQQEFVNVTELARLMGVTKGAVSQVVVKLEKKGLIERYKNPKNNKEVLLRLTPKGNVAFEGHEKYHKDIDAAFFIKLGRFKEEEIVVLETFLGKLEEFVDKHLECEKK